MKEIMEEFFGVNNVRKIFMLLWTPICVLSALAVTTHVGHDTRNGIITFNDVYLSYFVYIGVTIILYVLVGLDGSKKNE